MPVKISGVHLVLESNDPDADRAFFRDVLGLPYIDAGDGWLIFRLPQSEAAFHQREANDGEMQNQVYLMCDDLKKEIRSLQSKGVKCGKVIDASWGSVTKLNLPGGSEIGLYQPRHTRPL